MQCESIVRGRSEVEAHGRSSAGLTAGLVLVEAGAEQGNDMFQVVLSGPPAKRKSHWD